MTDFTNANALIDGYKRVKKASGWKTKTQSFGLNLLREVRSLQKDLRNGTYKQEKGTTFNLCEQGHLRCIKALTVRDTVAQHALCNEALIPAVRKHLIHDNGASLKGKGISFTRKRFEQHLRWHYQRYGTEGYVLKIDFRKYFDNIRHDVLLDMLLPLIKTYPYVEDNLLRILEGNRVDISFTDNPDYDKEVFSSLEYEKIDKSLLTGKRLMGKSMGIGSPVSQIAGIFLPTPIDTWCKTVRGIHCYDAYMDDRIIIHRDKEFLHTLLEEIKAVAKTIGVYVHEKKTQIIKLSHGFTFLKTKYHLTPTGKIIRSIPRDVVVRQRRKLKKLILFVQEGSLTRQAFVNQYKSWRGDKARYSAHHTLINMDKLHKELIIWQRKHTLFTQTA